MGHLAQRYRDASRSGVYRVTDAAVPRKAAAEAGSTLACIEIADGDGAATLLETMLADPGREPRVVIIDGADAMAAERASDFRVLVAALDSAACARREHGAPFFAVLVDPRKILPLPTLYNEPAAIRPDLATRLDK